MRYLISGLMLAVLCTGHAWADDLAIDPLTPQAESAPVKSPEDLMRDIYAKMDLLNRAQPEVDKLYLPAFRDENRKQLLPLMKELSSLEADYISRPEVSRNAKFVKDNYYYCLTLMSLYGDEGARHALDAIVVNGNDDAKYYAKASLLSSQWFASTSTPAKQQELLAPIGMFVDQHADTLYTGQFLARLIFHGAANAENKSQIKSYLAKLTFPEKDTLVRQIEDRENPGAASAKAAEKLPNLAEVDKPFVLKYKTVDGKDFSIDQLKGKVVLIDFWTTWCAPCKAELPHVIETYKKYHDQGLEVVSISLDSSPDDLNAYLKKNPDMSWTHLFDLDKPGTQYLAGEYRVTAIPKMFLIDKKGMLRSVTARENYKEMIPKLLAE